MIGPWPAGLTGCTHSLSFFCTYLMTSVISAILGENSAFEGYPASAAKDPQWSLDIARTLGRRFIPGEKAIASSPEAAYHYAREIIKGRWPEGEYAIKRLPWKAYFYARDTIKGRWPEAEKYILQDAMATINYVFNIVKSPWPEAEENIAKDAAYSYLYAANVLKRRFYSGEATVANSAHSSRYLNTFPEAKEDWALAGWIDWLDT